ncbi:hypothetical protein PYCCODRAFT_1470027 [Trametes coccinea BRFM310]|uniref:Uncharacterized protein n=1 Tax=Trametes coccinea (strain BRFM310) TaxID=1353009 RepID=A0A1Y2IF47_TRAC3|nr:hypothetical protein PYCCODRAFT_1470027 [Trametes coccinea BRFM310]
MSDSAMSAAAKLTAVKAQLAELERLAEEERRQEEERRKAEKEARKRAEEEARRKAEEEKRRAEEEKKKAEEERRRTEEATGRRDEEEEDEAETGKGKGKEPAGLLKPSSPCNNCRSWGTEAAPCLGAKGLPAPMQAQVDKKSGESPPRKRVKKSAPIVVEDDDEPATPTKKKSKKTGSGAAPRSSEKGPGAAVGVAESGGEGSGRVSLGWLEKEWSADPEPEQLTDRELLQHVLVEGQKTRLGMSHLLRHMEEEGELRAQWALADFKVMCQAVRKEMGKWAEEELQPLIRAEIRSVLAEFFATPAEQEDGEGQEEGEGQEGEGEGGEAGEEGAPAE